MNYAVKTHPVINNLLMESLLNNIRAIIITNIVVLIAMLPFYTLNAQHSSKPFNPEFVNRQIAVLNNDSLRFLILEGDLDATIVDSNNDTSSLSNLLKQVKGKPTLVVFWSTFCAPCLKAMPKIIDIQNEYGRSKFDLVFINIFDNFIDWKIWNDASVLLKNQTSVKIIDYFQCDIVQNLIIRSVGRYIMLDEQNRVCNSYDSVFSESFVNKFRLMMWDAGAYDD